MAGAGVSTAAGIPDFRTPGSGLYDNLQKYNLPFAEAIFTIHYFRENPEPFFQLAKEMYPGKWKPTTTHYFVKLLEQKGLLLRHFTQNIDTLERVAGIDPEKIVEAHGSFGEAHCIECDTDYPSHFVEACVMAEPVKVPRCTSCSGLVKPKITFFGENLPARFSQRLPDLQQAELLLVLGTSLKVFPFASLVDRVESSCPRVLFNREPVGPFGATSVGRNVTYLGDCDSGVLKLAELLGWSEELKQVIAKGEQDFHDAAKQVVRNAASPSSSSVISNNSNNNNNNNKIATPEPVEQPGGGFAVYPKTDCPHVEQLAISELVVDVGAPCSACGDTSENWLCLNCGNVGCSRYVKGHMAEHMTTACKQGICASFRDFSFWCYACDSYIVHSKLAPIKRALNYSKFGDE